MKRIDMFRDEVKAIQKMKKSIEKYLKHADDDPSEMVKPMTEELKRLTNHESNLNRDIKRLKDKENNA